LRSSREYQRWLNRRGQQGENHTNYRLLIGNLYNDFPVSQMNKAVQSHSLSGPSIASSSL